MTFQLAPERPSGAAAPPAGGTPLGLVAAAAAVRGAAVALSGMLFAAAISLVLWALTPASGSDATSAARAGVAGFAAANLMPVTIGGVVLSVPPLLFTVLIVALIVGTSRRGRFLPVGRDQETVAVFVTGASYGLVVAVTTRGFAPDGVVPAGWVWSATVLALVATAGAVLSGSSVWHAWWRSRVVVWLRTGTSAAVIGLCTLIAGGGVALTVAMVARFGSIVGVGALAAPSWTDGLGMALLGAAYVPNAIIAAVGYISGVGFEIGAGSYSPFAANAVDLPALPLLAAAPDHAGRSVAGMAFLAIPVIAGYLIARRVSRDLASRSERVLAAGSAAVLTGVGLGCLTWLARGGVGNGPWSTIGAPPLLVGAVVAVEVAVVAVGTSALVAARTVPWRPVESSAAQPVIDHLAEGSDRDSEDAIDEGFVADADADADAADAEVDADAADAEVDADAADGRADSVGEMDGEPVHADADPDREAGAVQEQAAGEPVDPDADPDRALDVAQQRAVGDPVNPDPELQSARWDESESQLDPAEQDSEIASPEPQDPATARAVTLPEQRVHTGDTAAPPATDIGTDRSGPAAPAESERSAAERAGQRDDHQHAGRRR